MNTLPPYEGETLLQRTRRLLGGADTRPPPNWPFPTWKGRALVQLDEDGPPAPARRGPKTRPGPPTDVEDAPL